MSVIELPASDDGAAFRDWVLGLAGQPVAEVRAAWDLYQDGTLIILDARTGLALNESLHGDWLVCSFAPWPDLCAAGPYDMTVHAGERCIDGGPRATWLYVACPAIPTLLHSWQFPTDGSCDQHTATHIVTNSSGGGWVSGGYIENGSADTGYISLRVNVPAGGNLVPCPASTTITLTALIRNRIGSTSVPVPPAGETHGRIRAIFYDSADASISSAVIAIGSGDTGTQTGGAWESISGSVTSPAGTAKVGFELYRAKNSDGTEYGNNRRMDLDDVYLYEG